MLGILAGSAAGIGVLAAAGYNTMAAQSQLYGRTFVRAAKGSRQIALTYDDGPNDPWTLCLLEVLARHDVKATFFMIGQFAAQKPQIARDVASAGHVIGNHTYSHPNLALCSKKELERQITECHRALTDAVGEHSNLFRPPFGGRRPQVLRSVRNAGLVPIMWSITGWDWNAKSASRIEQKVAPAVRGGDVILLHDGGHLQMGSDRSFTVKATDHLISKFKAQGYSFATIPEMMSAPEPVVVAGSRG